MGFLEDFVRGVGQEIKREVKRAAVSHIRGSAVGEDEDIDSISIGGELVGAAVSGVTQKVQQSKQENNVAQFFNAIRIIECPECSTHLMSDYPSCSNCGAEIVGYIPFLDAIEPDMEAYETVKYNAREAQYTEHNLKRAVVFLTMAHRLKPDDPSIHLRAGLYEKMEEYHKAIVDHSHLQRETGIPSHEKLAELYFEVGDYDNAIANSKIQIEKNLESINEWTDDEPVSEEAESYRNSVIERTCLLYFICGYSYIAKGDYKKAVAEFNAVLKIDPDNEDAKEGIQKAKESRPRLERWQEAAEAGDALAQADLGAAYFMGDEVTKNYKLAVEWLQKSAAQGNAEGQFWLANCYYEGKGVEEDYAKAEELYLKAKEQGHAESHDMLRMLRDTIKREQEHEERKRKDEERKREHEEFMRARLAAVAPVSAPSSTVACQACNAPVPADSAFCAKCGAKMVKPDESKPCPSCAAPVPADSAFCNKCGCNMAGGTTSQTETSAQDDTSNLVASMKCEKELFAQNLAKILEDSHSVYIEENIPPKKLKNALSKIPTLPDEKVFALVDETVFGSAKDATLITDWGYRHKAILSEPFGIPWEKFKNKTKIKCTSVNNYDLSFPDSSDDDFSIGTCITEDALRQIFELGAKTFAK